MRRKSILDWLRRARDEEGGATALEFAIVASVFVISAMGVFEFGRSLQVRNEMAYAMDHGARAVLMGEDDDKVKEIVKERFNSYDKDKLTVEVVPESAECESGKSVAGRAVTTSYPLEIFIPGFTGTLDMKLERTVPKGRCV